MRRAAILVALLGAAGCKPGPPTGFGVNLTVTSALPEAELARATKVIVTVSGAEEATEIVDIKAFQGSEARIRYLPVVREGTLEFTVSLHAADDASIGFGDSGPVALDGSRASNVTITVGPSKKQGEPCKLATQCATPAGCEMGHCRTSLGAGCQGDAECASGHCTSGVCCEEAACAPCRSCSATGKCDTVVMNAEEPENCSGTQICDATGACKTKGGEMCDPTMPVACLSGFCAPEALCCDTACTGLCQSCAVTPGMCTPILLAEDDTCRISSMGAQMCDQAGTCQRPHLIKDLNTTPASSGGTQPSLPAEFVQGPNNLVYFSAQHPSQGRQLWVTDGTSAGTRLVRSTSPLTNMDPRELTVFNNAIYFRGQENGVWKLFRSDGTESGTTVLRDLNMGNSAFTSVERAEFTVFKNELYFVARGFSPASTYVGCELWKTDGTPGGTVLVKDIMAGAGNSEPSRLQVMGSHLYFSAADIPTMVGSNVVPGNFELWRTDGTTAGTKLVADLTPGLLSTGFAGNFAATSSTLFFAANAAVNSIGIELYKSDGTEAGTVFVKDIFQGPGWGLRLGAELAAIGDTVYFGATDGKNGVELWKSDGTSAGTVMVKDILPGSGGSSPSVLRVAGGRLWFEASDGTTGRELWRSDGTAAGTQLVRDLAPGTSSSTPRAMTGFAGRVFFYTESFSDRELWVTDGTTAGTVSACQGMQTDCRQVDTIAVAGGRLFFSADNGNGTTGREPYALP